MDPSFENQDIKLQSLLHVYVAKQLQKYEQVTLIKDVQFFLYFYCCLQAYMLRAETGAKILALGVTSRVNRADFLRNMADENSYFQAEDFTQLMEKVTDIRDDVSTRNNLNN